MPTNCFVIIAVIFLVGTCGCAKNRVNKFKRKVDNIREVHDNLVQTKVVNTSSHDGGRGFFTPGLLSLGKVLNFFPVGGERECQPSEFTVARAGICLNAYDCRQRDGRAAGDCAHGLGVCCVFEVTCGGTVQNNLTYFMSPGFPELWAGDRDCNITIDKTHAGVTQLRVDFVHFTIGQPNRTTGDCDEDAMILGEGGNKVVVCGQNHGQHLYYTLSSGSEVREAGDLPSTKSTRLSIHMGSSEMPRLWLLRLAQLPLAYSAPHDCRQYHTSNNGTIKTFNFAINGRHLANQEYRACIRRNVGFCAVRYTPCDARSFRIGPGGGVPYVMDPSELEYGPGSQGGAGTGFYGPDGSYVGGPTTVRTNVTSDQLADDSDAVVVDGSMQQEQLMPSNGVQTPEDEMEGSGADPQMAPVMADSVAPPSIASRSGRSSRTWGWGRWSPYAQHYAQEDDKFRYYGYGNFGVGLQGFGRQRCHDRITIPCENEYFVSSTSYIPGVCDPHHCGDTFCPGVQHQNCRVETSISPFAVSVHFGPPTRKRSPEENIGACLRYTQLPCDA